MQHKCRKEDLKYIKRSSTKKNWIYRLIEPHTFYGYTICLNHLMRCCEHIKSKGHYLEQQHPNGLETVKKPIKTKCTLEDYTIKFCWCLGTLICLSALRALNEIKMSLLDNLWSILKHFFKEVSQWTSQMVFALFSLFSQGRDCCNVPIVKRFS